MDLFVSDRSNLDATKKRYHAEKNLSKNLQEKDRIEREFVKKREKVSQIPSITRNEVFFSFD